MIHSETEDASNSVQEHCQL